ncbi:hypothetical protein [Microtetraspora sp. NBRC 16547]|uniref:hypothetical protein n=1 Tax=Microtetraspora sp. NBRC 16547 TaxID=3030993 RepID=UPI0024A54036|nr:hypothetical protein [Microtetraspora sp. NBRC 16547]GLW98056.1 hypothetical protein Misp02_21430 [Microtetraspora sp. NBRC 16547]
MSRSRHSSPARLIGSLSLLALLVVACGEREPTVAEAAASLQTHVLRLLKERGALNVRITDPGGKNISCGEGKAKRTFAATGEDADPRLDPGSANDALVGALGRAADHKYHLADPMERPYRLANKVTRTFLVLDSVTGRYVVRGETECLSRS